MEEQLELAIKNVAENAQYDKYAKKLLSNKVFLAYILKDTIPDLSGLSPAEIIPLIEGEVEVSEVPVDPARLGHPVGGGLEWLDRVPLG